MRLSYPLRAYIAAIMTLGFWSVAGVWFWQPVVPTGLDVYYALVLAASMRWPAPFRST